MNNDLIMKQKCAVFIIMSGLLGGSIRKKKPKKLRRYWMKHLYQQRTLEGSSQLLNILSLDESTGHFKNFLRMSPQDFEILLNKIGPKIQKKDTNLRKAISAKERLAITLRFLATGDSYSSLQYLFKVSKQIIAEIIPDVCSALIEVLKDYIKVSQMKSKVIF